MHMSTDRGTVHDARMEVLQGSRVALPARELLLERLLEETGGATAGKRVTLFLAPIGYGKSTTVASWLGDGSDSSDPVRWVNCSTLDSASLWQHIADVITPFTAAAHVSSETVLTHEDVIRLARRLERPVSLVLDDYHSLTNVANDVAVAQLSGASPLLDLVVIACRVSALDGPLVTAQTRVRIVDSSDLAFTRQEQLDLAGTLGLAHTDCLEQALARSEGWPLALRATLNIGSDLHHFVAPRYPQPDGQLNQHAFDPVANMRSFALTYLDLTTPHARTVLLAATLLDAISTAQIQKVTQLDADTTHSAINELLELGLLREVTSPAGIDYRAHPSMRDALLPRAQQSFAPEVHNNLLADRAREIELSAPLAAFTLYCRTAEFTSAESVLARNFTTLTNETDELRSLLRALPEEVQRNHPTFTAALLFLETPDPSVAPSTLEYLTSFWLQNLQQRLPGDSPAESDPIFLQLLCQAMVATRITGQLETATSLMLTLERRLTPARIAEPVNVHSGIAPPQTESSLIGSLPTYYRELAATALAVSDFARARHALKLLRDLCARQMATPWNGFGYAATRTVTGPQGAARWMLAALSELAFTELLDGNMRRCEELVAEFDTVTARTGENAPGISWVGAEVTRAHLAFELSQPELLTEAMAKLAPFRGRLEPWPLVLMAESLLLREQRGTDWALAHLRSAISTEPAKQQLRGEWLGAFTAFKAMLCTTTGNLARAQELIERCDERVTSARLERARLALYSGDDVSALLMTRNIGDPETTQRQRVDRSLISAVAAWNCGQPDDAIAALADAATHMAQFGLRSKLLSVPYETLVAVTSAAREAGVCDLTEVVAAIPELARSVRYERLTEMELQTLIAIYTHRNANQAAASLHVTPGTVKKHLISVYKKLRVNGRDEAILRMSRMGLIETS